MALFDKDKLAALLRKLCTIVEPALDQAVQYEIDALVANVQQQLPAEKIDDYELYELVAQTCAYRSKEEPDWELLASRVLVQYFHEKHGHSVLEKARKLRENCTEDGRHYPLISKEQYQCIERNAEALQQMVNYERDYTYRFFGICTQLKSYLLREHGFRAIQENTIETPQDMLLRHAVFLYGDDMDAVRECYELASLQYYTPATPSLLNAGTLIAQMSSCFLLQIPQDSLDSIYDALKQCAMIAKSAGGIGLAVHRIRASGTAIKKTNGQSNGLVPMLRVYDSTARYVDQGGGKRKGAIAIYLEPWHADIYDFLDLRKNNGKEERRARDLFYALWTCDLFMKRVEQDGNWSLFCPDKAPGLHNVWGKEFETLYERYEREGRANRTVRAQDLLKKICESEIETGTPYMLYKDHCNAKSNQRHLGTIQCSNLCCEVIQYTSEDEIAVCNLSSVALPKFVNPDCESGFDFEQLRTVVRLCVRNLNRVIDRTHYPLEECRRSNLRHRPMGIGVQGIADVFAMLSLPMDSKEASAYNKSIFEQMYYAALDESCRLAERDGHYESYQGSPMSEGKLQPDLWPEFAKEWEQRQKDSSLDWSALRKRIAKYGVRNSLLLAPMPTASTAQILGNTEGIEALTSNLYVRRVLSGEFYVVNRYLVRDLKEMGLWTSDVRAALERDRGSVQNIRIPPHFKQVYKTVWELKQKSIVDLAAGRAPYIDQSQSLNIHIREPTVEKLMSLHMYTWKRGLKTGMYYLRSAPAANPINVTSTVHGTTKTRKVLEYEESGTMKKRELECDAEESAAKLACRRDNAEDCLMCGS